MVKTLESDNGGAGKRIGLIVLSTDLATERDFRRALAGHDVEFNTARIRNVNPNTKENLLKMGPRLTECASLLLPGMPIDVIAYSCTAATVVLGYDTVLEQMNAGRPGVPVATPATAALHAFESVAAKRIAVLTPYLESVGCEVTGFIESNGYEVVASRHLDYDDDRDMAYLAPASILEAAESVDHPDADAIFISCTAIRAMETLQELEERTGKPCFSSIQCLLWDSLRLAGYEPPVAGYGQLLDQPRISA